MNSENQENSEENALVNQLAAIAEKTSRNFELDAPLPVELPLLPLLRRPFFPGMAAPILFEKGPFFDILKSVAKSEHKCVGLLLTKKEDIDIYKVTMKDLHRFGVLARILKIVPMEGARAQVIFNMEKRLKVVRAIPQAPFLMGKVTYYEDDKKLTDEIKAHALSITTTIKELLKLNPLFKEELQIFLGHSDFTEPGKLADFAVALTTATRDELQEVLEAVDISERIEKALRLLKKELDLTRLQQTINKKIESTISKGQREFFLREQLKTIKRELGIEKDDKSIDREKFEERLKKRKVPKVVKSVIADELEKLSILDPHSAEYTVCRGYLDWLTVIPWGVKSPELHDLAEAEKILQKDHYGLEDIKQRILELIGVGKLTKGMKGTILCLVGPPGVGKTSIGKSIARALNREFYRFSVGGMRDEAEIKGHRRTYIGAMPGKLIQALKWCQTMNPVIMLDEVDKMGTSYHGDPASALLEVLDPEQNNAFLDHYLDVPCDLSNVVFIVTANLLDTIPAPLRDRMDILRLSGYILQEKLEIAKRYLIPRNRKLCGLKAKEIAFETEALRSIINGYARESGVRSLEHSIRKILRKVALHIVRERDQPPKKGRKKSVPTLHKITTHNLEEYLGKPIFMSDRFYATNPVGVCTGLAWTAMGGATLYIETIKIPAEKTEMQLTGQAGEVMKESSQIAWSYLHSALHKYAPDFTFFEKSQVHLHIPEGATPKDGPSAGITMVTALLSLLTNTPVRENLGMTGELTLTGCVLPVGGIKEKVVAARRSGLKELILPRANERDYLKLPAYLTEDLVIHFVDHYDAVWPLAFPKQAPS